MAQHFKAIYFPGQSVESPAKTLTLAFNEDNDIYDRVRTLSSHEIRILLGFQTYEQLKIAAEEKEFAINTFCLRILREKIKASGNNLSYQLPLPNIPQFERSEFDPIYATFRGGIEEPLHMWYPYLEGYSPKFVQTIIKTFASNAKIVYDPFAGTGTTPLTGMNMGLTTYYSEINPLLQFLIEIKILAYKVSNDKREILASEIRALSKDWARKVNESRTDTVLRDSYFRVFGKSTFFDQDTFDSILKTRTTIDRLLIANQTLARLSTVAVLSSLLSSSNLIRSGDIRYRNNAESERKTQFINETARRLILIADDLERIETPQNGTPIFLCEDARSLKYIPGVGIDLVVTSPPYLNGTNYFRNTKIELWFLRCLQSQEDLAAFRYKAVTSGINDVTVEKTNGKPPSIVNEVIKSLESNAYDSRIPRMVSGYFYDMNLIFQGLNKHLVKNATIAIDIGDSVYAGVHVPVQQLMIGFLDKLGYALEHEVTLRKRLSRDRTELSQVLLIFRYEGKQVPKIPTKSYDWIQSWRYFKSDLPFKEQPYAKRNWGHPLHSLCSYQGKMKPSVAHFLVRTFVRKGDRILDPFAGVGTIPFEASLLGAKSFGFDISAAALAIAKGKVENTQEGKCFKLISTLEKYIDENEPTEDEHKHVKLISFNSNITDYFHPKTFKEILLARRFFIENPPSTASESLVLACLLHILHGNRPYALSRRSHPITPFKPTGDFIYKSLISNLHDKVTRSFNIPKPEEYIEGKIYDQDATSWWPQDVDKLDAIITSPPFFDSTRFHMGNWMRLWFCGWEKQDFKEKPLAFIDERQKSSFDIYKPFFRQARERLKSNGILVMHLGESAKCDMAKELSSIAEQWFKVLDNFSENVADLEHHGIRDKGTVTRHQFLILS